MLFANVMFVLGLRRMTLAYYQSIGVRPTGEAANAKDLNLKILYSQLVLSGNTKMHIFLVLKR